MRLGASVLAGVLTSALGLGLIAALPGAAIADSTAVGPATGQTASGSTTFRIATFNVLGNSHTTAKGDESSRPSGKKRMADTVRALGEGKPSIIGFQEMEGVQYDEFKALTGSTYGTYPGDDPDQLVVANNLAWRNDTWRLLSATTFTVPYFYGKYSRRPLVLLQNVHTGQEVYVMNTHNPANTRGNALAYRNQAVQIEAALITRLRSTHPDIPVLFTGDMNDWDNFYCPMTAAAPVHAAYGGSHVFAPTDQCTTPKFTVPKGQNPNPIDWIMGSPDVRFSGPTRLKDAVVAAASDHPLYWADASVNAARDEPGVRHVVAIDAEGLTSTALTKAGGKDARFLNKLRAGGASTLEARTEPDSTKVLPNTIGMLTGRPVLKKNGGHGVKGGDDGRSVKKHAKKRIQSVYDVVRKSGRSTALYASDPAARMVQRSWKHKINTTKLTDSDKKLATAFRKKAGHLKSFSFVQLSGAVRAGEHSGWKSKAYKKAVKQVSHRIATMVHAVQSHPSVAANTVFVITSSAGGKGHATGGSKRADFRVPFIVWGHGVPAGQDLYALNPAALSPGSGNPGLDVGQPIRNASVADLATSALGLPAVKGSLFDSGGDLNVFHAPRTPLPHDPALTPAA